MRDPGRLMTPPNLDPEILGHILVLQNGMAACVSGPQIIDMVVHGLKRIPGIDLIEFKSSDDGLPPSTFHLRHFPIRSTSEQFGNLVIHLQQPTVFEDYAPFVSNTLSLAAIHLEKIHTQQSLDQSNRDLLKLAEERNAKYRFLFEEMTEGVIYQDHHGKVLRANAAAQKILGAPLEQLQNQPHLWPNAIDESGSNCAFTDHPCQRALNSQKPVTNAVMGVTQLSTGKRIWLEIDAIPQPRREGHTPSNFILFRDITIRRCAEQALKETTNTLNDLYHNAPCGYHSLDENGLFLRINDTELSWLGYTREEVIGKLNWHDVVAPEYIEELKKNFNLFKREGTVRNLEYEILRKDGSRFRCLLSATALYDNQGQFVMSRTTVIDISDRYFLEQEARRIEKELNTALECMRDAIFIADPFGKIVKYNQAFATFHRFQTPEECPKSTQDFGKILDIYDLNDQWLPIDQRIIAMALRGESGSDAQLKLHRKDTGETWIGGFSYAPIRNERNEITGAIIMARDITRQKAAETQLKIAATAFRSQDGITITDADCQIIRVNPAFTEITGYTQEEVLGKNPRILQSGRHNREFFSRLWQTINETGHWRGEIWDRRKDGSVYPARMAISAVKNNEGQVINYVATFTDISKRKTAEARIEHMAFHDQLTDLPNRQLLLDRMAQARLENDRNQFKCAILLIDLDDFKTLNDAHGHEIGDELLKLVAQRLALSVRAVDTVARIGGDEFVILLKSLSSKDIKAAQEVDQIASKLLNVIRQPFAIDPYSFQITCSIGVTIAPDEPGKNEDMLKQADIALYQAKQAGRDNLKFFDDHMQIAITRRSALKADLNNALKKKQMRLFYQPQVDTHGEFIGAEALARWVHPDRGLVPPGEFIPLAEESDLIIALGQWVLETACAQLAQWQLNAETRNLSIAVNVSAKQLRQTDFVEHVHTLLDHYQIPPSQLKIELTETLLLQNIEYTIEVLNALRKTGIHLSLDDFGTGYSSLSYLKKLPLTQLKIDQSFVRDIIDDPNDRAIIHTIIAMAKHLHLAVIAEGVETTEQMQFLKEAGCEHYQGYLFGKPMTIDAFENCFQQ